MAYMPPFHKISLGSALAPPPHVSKRIASSSGIQEHSRPSLLLNLFTQGLSVSTGPCEDKALHPSAELSAVRASAEAELEKNQEDDRLSGEMGMGPQTKPWEIPPTLRNQ